MHTSNGPRAIGFPISSVIFFLERATRRHYPDEVIRRASGDTSNSVRPEFLVEIEVIAVAKEE